MSDLITTTSKRQNNWDYPVFWKSLCYKTNHYKTYWY